VLIMTDKYFVISFFVLVWATEVRKVGIYYSTVAVGLEVFEIFDMKLGWQGVGINVDVTVTWLEGGYHGTQPWMPN